MLGRDTNASIGHFVELPESGNMTDYSLSAGEYESYVDDKGRLLLPLLLKIFLGPRGRCFVTTFDKTVGRIYPEEDWKTVLKELTKRESANPDKESLMALALRYGVDSQVDDNNRLLIPEALTNALQIEKGFVHLRWHNDHIEIRRSAKPLEKC